MKRLFSLLLIWSATMGFACAQMPEHLTRSVLEIVPDNEMVSYGEFQSELLKMGDYKTTAEGYWFAYLYTVRNKYTDKCNIMINGKPLFVNRNMRVRTYRIGPSLDRSIFVFKNMDREADDIGYGMELVRAYGISQQICDSVLMLNDDGFVYYSEGKCFYSPYRRIYDNPTETVPVAWLERKVFDNEKQQLPPEKAAAFERLSKGAVYYESFNGNYYYLYQDRYMPYTVAVINNTVVELFDVYNEDNFKLRFSYNGQHWMAVGKECYWIDGAIHSIKGFAITDFVITDNGHYGYKAYQKGASETGEIVVVDGQIIRRNAKVCYFGLNAEGKLKFRFVSSGRYLQYENEQITDVTDNLAYTYYLDNPLNGDAVTVQSNDGKHKLTYQVDTPSVKVDGVEMAKSVPCSAIYDERNHAFIWNAIENKGGKTELVVYKYTIANNFFKNLF